MAWLITQCQLVNKSAWKTTLKKLLKSSARKLRGTRMLLYAVSSSDIDPVRLLQEAYELDDAAGRIEDEDKYYHHTSGWVSRMCRNIKAKDRIIVCEE